VCPSVAPQKGVERGQRTNDSSGDERGTWPELPKEIFADVPSDEALPDSVEEESVEEYLVPHGPCPETPLDGLSDPRRAITVWMNQRKRMVAAGTASEHDKRLLRAVCRQMHDDCCG
jgi:hypothetical protein